MSGGVRGDLSQLSEIRKRIDACLQIPERTAQAVAAPLTAQIQGDFAAHRSPDGSGWPATKTMGARTLHRTGALQASLVFTPRGRKLGCGFISYGKFQDPRLFIPRSGKLPDSYRTIIDTTSARIFRELAEGRR